MTWNCDFCGKSGLLISKAGILYCEFCRKSYGKQIGHKIEEKLKEIENE